MGKNGCILNFSILRNTSIQLSGLQITVSHRKLAAQDFLMFDQRSDVMRGHFYEKKIKKKQKTKSSSVMYVEGPLFRSLNILRGLRFK